MPVKTAWPQTRQKRASGSSGALQRVQFMTITFQPLRRVPYLNV